MLFYFSKRDYLNRNYQGISLILVLWLMTGCAPHPPIPSPGHINQPPAAPPKDDIPPTVQQLPFVPPPESTSPVETYTVVVSDVPVEKLLFALARDAGLNVDIHPGIKGNISLNAISQTLPQLLERIAKQVDLRYQIDDNLLKIGPDLPYIRIYPINYVNLSRDTKTTMNVSTQIIGQAGATGEQGGGGGGGGGGQNNSQVEITNISNNRFWQTLGNNILAILGKPTQTGGGEAAGNVISTPEVMVNPESGMITIRATHKQHEEIQRVIDQIQLRAQRQVLIEATIMEVRLTDQYQAGIDWQRIAGDFTYAQAVTIGNLGNPPFYSFGYNNPNSQFGNISATVRLLEQFGTVKVLSSPRVMVLNNQTAVLKVVDNKVYFTVKAVPSTQTNLRGDITVYSYTTTPNVLPVGLILNVTPQITDEEVVTLNVRPTISRIIGAIDDPNPDLARAGITSKVPEIQVREMESLLKINNGDVAVIGGLMQDTTDQTRIGVPVLSQLPLVGDLFSYRNDSYTKTELIIFLRPVVIKDASLEGDLKDYKVYLPNQ